MTDLIGTLGSYLGYVMGLLSDFAYSVARSIATGNKDDLIMTLITLIIVYIVFTLVVRIVSTLWILVRILVKISIVGAIVWSAAFVFYNGPSAYQLIVFNACSKFWNAYSSKLQDTLTIPSSMGASYLASYLAAQNVAADQNAL